MVRIEERARKLFEDGEKRARKKGFKSRYEYWKDLARKKGFNSYYEYWKYIKDPDFREIYFSNGSDRVRENNPYLLMSIYLEQKTKLGFVKPEIKEKLEEIIAGMSPKEKIRYIEILKRGVEIQKGKLRRD